MGIKRGLLRVWKGQEGGGAFQKLNERVVHRVQGDVTVLFEWKRNTRAGTKSTPCTSSGRIVRQRLIQGNGGEEKKQVRDL